MQLGEVLKSARLAKSLSQAEAATRLGITPQYYGDIEKNRRAPTIVKTVKKIAVFTGLSERDVLYLTVFKQEWK